MRKHVYQSDNFGKKLLFISTFKCHVHKPGQGDNTKQARLGLTTSDQNRANQSWIRYLWQKEKTQT